MLPSHSMLLRIWLLVCRVQCPSLSLFISSHTEFLEEKSNTSRLSWSTHVQGVRPPQHSKPAGHRAECLRSLLQQNWDTFWLWAVGFCSHLKLHPQRPQVHPLFFPACGALLHWLRVSYSAWEFMNWWWQGSVSHVTQSHMFRHHLQLECILLSTGGTSQDGTAQRTWQD